MELLEVNNLLVVKEVLFEGPELGTSINVKIPFDNNVYIFETLITPKDKEICSQEFDKFLKTVSIE